MPKTPQVNFKIVNQNVESSVPLLGVTHVVARTTKGPFNDPSTLITGIEQFRRLYGQEVIVGDSVSSIEKALSLGSKLRISRVEGVSGATKGAGSGTLDITFVNSTEVTKASLSLQSLYGGQIFDDSQVGKDLTITPAINAAIANKVVISLTLKVGTTELSSGVLINGGDTWIDWTSLRDYFQTAPFEVSKVVVTGTLKDSITTLDGLLDWMSKAQGVGLAKTANYSDLTVAPGSDGGNPSQAMYIKAFKATLDYIDAYQVIFPQAYHYTFQKLDNKSAVADATGYTSMMKEVAAMVVKAQEEVLYVEVPVKDAAGNVLTLDQLLTNISTLQGIVGTSPYIAYFTGGLKYYNGQGNLVDSDVVGTVAGLGDASASTYGPWKSFSGMNRGVVTQAKGPVMENLGTPTRIDDLQKLADYSVNTFVVKDTRTQGKQTMLWHGFTSNPKSDSERFLSIVRLNLYLKKNIRPILESYLEEPNIWDTWQNIYFEGKPLMDDLVTNQAISEYEWMGDQNASSYQDLVVNTEAEVRQGKYKLIIKYKDIVPIQDIQVTLTIDQASRTVSSEVTTSNV